MRQATVPSLHTFLQGTLRRFYSNLCTDGDELGRSSVWSVLCLRRDVFRSALKDRYALGLLATNFPTDDEPHCRAAN